MGQPYVGEVRMFAGNFAPSGWMLCNGQLLAISEYDALFVLLGTTYGGDGQQTFGLPDLQGRVPIHMGNSATIGEKGGAEEATLNGGSIPVHTHSLLGTLSTATAFAPANNVLATSTGATVSPYGSDNPKTTLAPQTVSGSGGSQPHANLQPYLCVNFIISLYGIFPAQT